MECDNDGNLISIVSENAFVSITLIDTICESYLFQIMCLMQVVHLLMTVK